MADLKEYNPFDWYWIIAGDETKAWSSKASAYVTSWPSDKITKIVSSLELDDVLAVFGIIGPGNVWEISKLTLVNRLVSAALFDIAISELKKNPVEYERWQASRSVKNTNSSVRNLLLAIGGDLDILLARE